MEPPGSDDEHPTPSWSPATPPKWRSAKEQFDLFDSDYRRFSEWPTVTAPGAYQLLRIDQISITVGLANTRCHRGGIQPKLNSESSGTRFNVLCCGRAAPIATLMLLKGARRVEAVQFGFEPLLVLCELDADPSLLDMPSFPATFTRQEIAAILDDEQALIDCLVWYDVGDETTFAFLDQLRMTRDAVRPGCSIVALQPCARPSLADAEFAAVRAGKSGFLAAADTLYNQVKQAITGRHDVMANSPLHELLEGGLAVLDTSPYDL